jgi:hypothetical protein
MNRAVQGASLTARIARHRELVVNQRPEAARGSDAEVRGHHA